jgi:hypothetical protein
MQIPGLLLKRDKLRNKKSTRKRRETYKIYGT